MVKSHVIDTIEKIFRYFIPGFIFIFLFKLSFPSNPEFLLKNVNPLEFYIYVPCIGMVIYGLHRVILSSILEPILYLANSTAVSNFSRETNIFKKLRKYPTALAKFFEIRHKRANDNLSGYLFYRWSIQHYSLILSELLLVFCFIHERDSLIESYKGTVLIFATAVLFFSLLFTVIMYRSEKELYKK